ncbi:MAG: PAS domain S-box protein [Campylobacterales bacterium]
MLINEFVQCKNVNVSPEASLGEIAQVMRRNGEGIVVISHEGIVEAVVSERDVVEWIGEGFSPSTPVGQLACSKQIVTVRLGRDATHALNIMLLHGIRHLCVVDAQGLFVGVISQRSLLFAMARSLFSNDLPVKNLVSLKPTLVTASPSLSLDQACRLMRRHNIGSLVVVKEDNTIIGIITESDIIKSLELPYPDALTIGDLMTPRVITIDEEALLREAYDVMVANNVRRLVVVGRSNERRIIDDRDIVHLLQGSYSRRLEFQLRHNKALLHYFPDPIIDLVELGGQMVVEWANEKAHRLFGPMLIDRAIEEFIDSPALSKILALCAETNNDTVTTVKIQEQWFEVRLLRSGEGGFSLLFHDVTQQRRLVETELQKGRFFHDMIRFHSSVMLLVDPENDMIVDANEAASAFYGHKTEELIGMKMSHINTASSQDLAQARLKAIAGDEHLFLFKHRLADGRIRDVEIHASPVEIDGRTLLFSIIHDVTVRRSLEENLKLARFSADAADESIYWFDEERRIIYANKHGCSELGYTLDSLLGSPVEILNTTMSEEELVQLFARMKEESSLSFETFHTRADGEIFPVEVRANYLSYHDRGVYCAFVRDITERKRYEEELRLINSQLEERVQEELKKREKVQLLFETIFNGAPLGIVVVNYAWQIVKANPAFCAMFSATAEELVGQSIEDLTHPDDREHDRKLFDQLRNGQTPWYQIQKRYITREQKIIHANITVSTLGLEREEGDGMVLGIVEDITEKLALAKKQRDQEQMLIQQSKMAAMGEMIGVIAHQWRQPLNTLGIYIQDLQDAYEFNELDKKYLDEMVRRSMEQILFMSRTIDDFRNFFRVDKSAESFKAIGAVRSVASLLGAQIKNHMIELSIEQDGLNDDELSVIGYPNEFKQVILNLINNAKDAIIERREREPSLDGRIVVSLQRDEDRVIVLVCDNGGGIPPAIMDRIFEPYFTTKGEGKGTGIGLYMSKMIIEDNMGGKISAYNTDEGACFKIVLKSA